jgi:Fe2+ or Zn2+ uptake regulation protein
VIDELKDALIKKGISPSFHRLKIYEYLKNNCVHPSVEMIYADVIKQIPTLSKTTIYNTLKTFVEKGIISPLTIEDNEVRYDADLAFHGHFKCLNCNTLYDIDIDQLHLLKNFCINKKINGHIVTERHVYLKGICKKCRQN